SVRQKHPGRYFRAQMILGPPGILGPSLQLIFVSVWTKRHSALGSVQVFSLQSAAASSSAFLSALASSFFASPSSAPPPETSWRSPNLFGHSAANATRASSASALRITTATSNADTRETLFITLPPLCEGEAHPTHCVTMT